MKKNLFVYALFALLLICIMVSCNSNTTKPQEVIAKSPATLKVNYFRQYYAVGDGPEKLVGTLSYTAEGGSSINTIDISSEDVKKEGFDTTVPAEGKTLKLTYKGIDCVVTYNVVKQETVDLSGKEFVVADNITLLFEKDNKVTKTTWNSWNQFYNEMDPSPEQEKEFTYTVGISSSGRTIVKVDGDNYYPDADGGLHSYPSTDEFFFNDGKYAPDMINYYVSTAPEDHRERTNVAARDKYLVMKFDYLGNAYMWFKALDPEHPEKLWEELTPEKAIQIEASKMSFGVGGVFVDKKEGTKGTSAPDNANKNLTIMLNKEGYDSTEKAFSFISYVGEGYNGYSYTMKLSDTLIP